MKLSCHLTPCIKSSHNTFQSGKSLYKQSQWRGSSVSSGTAVTGYVGKDVGFLVHIKAKACWPAGCWQTVKMLCLTNQMKDPGFRFCLRGRSDCIVNSLVRWKYVCFIAGVISLRFHCCFFNDYIYLVRPIGSFLPTHQVPAFSLHRLQWLANSKITLDF